MNVSTELCTAGTSYSVAKSPVFHRRSHRRIEPACAYKGCESPSINRRFVLSSVPAAALLVSTPDSSALTKESCQEKFEPYLNSPDWTGPGPLQVVHLPRLEHICASCFPACVGTSCLIRIDVAYPKGGYALGLGPPYPLAIFSSGFLVSSDSYRSYAERLASWGYTTLLYDRQDTVADILDDDTCVTMLRDLINWCGTDPLLRRITDTSRVFLVGHSRGGKLSALAAAADTRVAAVCLIDAVDNTQYAPLGPGYPSALSALRSVPREVRSLPVAIVGGGVGGDCAPRESNFTRFFEANIGPTWQLNIRDAGHFAFLDQQSPLQRAVCQAGVARETDVRRLSQAAMVAWAESMVRHQGRDVTALGLPPYPTACQQLGAPSPTTSSPSPPAARPPTWGSSLEDAYAVTLGPRKGAPASSQAVAPSSAVLAALAAPGATGSSSPPVGRRLTAMEEAASAPKQVDGSLRQTLDRLVQRLRYEMLLEVETRYKNLGE